MTMGTSARRFSVRGRFTPDGSSAPTHDVVIALTQAAGAWQATGRFTSTNLEDGSVFQGRTYGVIQQAKGWTSVTGRSTYNPTNEERAFTLTVDDADPQSAPGVRRATYEVAGAPPVRGVITAARTGGPAGRP